MSKMTLQDVSEDLHRLGYHGYASAIEDALDQPQPEVVECDNCGLTTGCMCLAVGIGSGPHRCPACSQPTRNAIAPIPRPPEPAGYTSANGLFFAAEPADAVAAPRQPVVSCTGSCGCPCEPSGSDGLRCPRADGSLLCGNKKPEPADAVSELPDDIRVPLDEVRADLGYLFGRVAADGSFMQAAVDIVRIKLDRLPQAIRDFAARHARGVLDAAWNSHSDAGYWVDINEDQPIRNSMAIYWHMSKDGGFPAIADEWRDEHHRQFASHWMSYRIPITAQPTKDADHE